MLSNPVLRGGAVTARELQLKPWGVRLNVICALLLFGASNCVFVRAQIPGSADISAPTFESTSVQRGKVTRTTVLLSFNARQETPQLDLKVTGSTSDLHRSEMKADEVETTLSGLRPGQKPQQLSATVTSAAGHSGEISISGKATGADFSSTELAASVPYENKKGQVKLGATTGAELGPVNVSAKPIGHTIEDGYVVKGNVKVFLKGVSKLSPADQKITVSAEGISLLDTTPTASTDTSQVTRSITFAAADGQKGRIITEVSGKDKAGRDYSSRSYVYVMADPQNLYTSTSGFLDLEIQQLNARHAAHLVSDDQYAVGMNAILSGETETRIKKQ